MKNPEGNNKVLIQATLLYFKHMLILSQIRKFGWQLCFLVYLLISPSKSFYLNSMQDISQLFKIFELGDRKKIIDKNLYLF